MNADIPATAALPFGHTKAMLRVQKKRHTAFGVQGDGRQPTPLLGGGGLLNSYSCNCRLDDRSRLHEPLNK
jgi:hypothetical protein